MSGIGSGRQFFSETEKLCLLELVRKYKLNAKKPSDPSIPWLGGMPAAKRMAWAGLVKEFNSYDTNSKRTETQLKKLWDNLKTRQKKTLAKKICEGFKTEETSIPVPARVPTIKSEGDPLNQTVVELEYFIDGEQCPSLEETTCGRETPPTGSDALLQSMTANESDIDNGFNDCPSTSQWNAHGHRERRSSENSNKSDSYIQPEDLEENSFNENEGNKKKSADPDDETENCVSCFYGKIPDKRNIYFSNMMAAELQFVPPCMRTKAYITILKYIETLKYKHK